MQKTCHTKTSRKSFDLRTAQKYRAQITSVSPTRLRLNFAGTLQSVQTTGRRRQEELERRLALRLDDVVGSRAQVVLGRHGTAAFASTSLMLGRWCRSCHPPLGDASVEDHVDIWILLESFNEVPV